MPIFRERHAEKNFIMSLVYRELGYEDVAIEFLRRSYLSHQTGRKKGTSVSLPSQQKTKKMPDSNASLEEKLEEELQKKFREILRNMGAVPQQPAYMNGNGKEWIEQELNLFDLEFYLEDNDDFIQITYRKSPKARHLNRVMELIIETKVDQVEYTLCYTPQMKLDGLDVITVREICRKWKDELEILKATSQEGESIYAILARLEDKYTRRNYPRYLKTN